MPAVDRRFAIHRLLTTLCRLPCLPAATAVLVLAGCGSPPRLPAVPGALQDEAVVPGMPNVRYRPPQVDALLKDLRTTVEREQAELHRKGYDGPLLPISFLALSSGGGSGGGDSGAFGAGLLVGWSAGRLVGWSAGPNAATGPSSTSSPPSAPAR